MSVTNPLFLQKTALDVQITYQNAGIQTPIIINNGTGIANVMEIDATDILEYDRTVTGDVSVALMPSTVTGRLHLHPQSPALGTISNVINSYYLTQIIIPGTIAVSSKSGGFSYSFTNVVFNIPFAGYNISKTLDDYVFSFKAVPPNQTSLSELVNSASGLLNLV